MGLVDYSSESDEEPLDPPTKPILKQKADEVELPPLPSAFHNLYTTAARPSTRDDPSLHGGRKRITPHVEGNWPTHIYIEWIPSDAEYAALTAIIDRVQKSTPESKIESHLKSDLGAPLPLHVSLSAPIGFSTDTKDDFLIDVRERITSCAVKSFSIRFSQLRWHANHSGNRWFLVLAIKISEKKELNRLLTTCNRVVQDYGQPPLYVGPVAHHQPVKQRQREGSGSGDVLNRGEDHSEKFHVSIGWSLSDPGDEDESLLAGVLNGDAFHAIMDIELPVNEVKVKIGNNIDNIALDSKTVRQRSLYGA